MEMKAAALRFGRIARRLLAPIAAYVTLAMCAPSRAAERIGIGGRRMGRAPIRYSKPNPNFPKPSQIQQSPGKIEPRKTLGFPWISLSESSLFNGLRRPPG